MATFHFNDEHLNAFNDFYLYLSEKIRDRKENYDERYFKDISDEVVSYYRSHNLYENILEKEYALYVIGFLAPPDKVKNNISYSHSKDIFHHTIHTIAADKNLTPSETGRIYYAHINALDREINGYSKEQLLVAYKESMKDHEDVHAENHVHEPRHNEHKGEHHDEHKVVPEDKHHHEPGEKVVEERREPVVTEKERVVTTERPVLDKSITQKIIFYHMDSFGIKSAKDFRNIMEGKSVGLFIASIVIGLILLALMVIYRNTLAFGENFFAEAMQVTGDAINTSPMIVLLIIFFILLLIILFAIFRYARFYEKRKLFLRNTPVLIKALDVDETTFNEIIDEKFYDEKVKLRNRTFSV